MRPFPSLSLASSVVAVTAGLALTSPASAQALRLGAQPAAVAAVSGGTVQQVQWRGGPGGPGWGGGGWRGGPGPGWGGGWAGRPGWGGGYGPGWGRPGWGGPVYYGGGWGYGYGPYYGGWGGFGPGLATGIIVGAAAANAAPVYGGPVYASAPPDWIAYCSRKYRSFDPRTGTFLGYDGRRHPCT